MWAEKHRPRTLSEIRGQYKAMQALKAWARSWQHGRPSHKAILLYGPPGTGKTSAALALGREMDWEVLEVNASDQRSRSSLEDLIRSSATRFSFAGKKYKLFVVDEVDGLSGTEDRGGTGAIADLVRNTVNPVILICNDPYSPKLRYLKRLAAAIPFYKLRESDVQSVLREVSRKEGMEPDFLGISMLARRVDGDLRSAINDLEAASVDGSLARELIQVPDRRNTDGNIFTALDKIYEGQWDSLAYARELDMTPDELLDWVAENLPKRFASIDELAAAYEVVSTVDIYLSRVYRRMHWGFWGYATELLARGLGSLRPPFTTRLYRRPSYTRPSTYIRYRSLQSMLDKPGEGQSVVRRRIEALRTIASKCHMSIRAAMQEFLPYLKIISENNREMALGMLRSMGLGEDELELLEG